MQRRQGIWAKDSGKCHILAQTREPSNREDEGKQEQRGCLWGPFREGLGWSVPSVSGGDKPVDLQPRMPASTSPRNISWLGFLSRNCRVEDTPVLTAQPTVL